MNELDRLNGLIERQAIRLEAEVRQIADLLRDLARMSRFLARESRSSPAEIEAWAQSRRFAATPAGWIAPHPAPGASEPQDAELLALWRSALERDPAAWRVLHRHRGSSDHLASALRRLPALRRLVHRAPCGLTLVHPPFDPSSLPAEGWDRHPLVRRLGLKRGDEGEIHWSTPAYSLVGNEITLSAAIQVEEGDEDLGLWIAEVALEPFFAVFAENYEGRGEEQLFVVNADGEFLFEEGFLEPAPGEPGDRLRGSLSDLGGEHWQLDFAEMRARGGGRIELLAEDGRRELLVFRAVAGSDWLSIAEIPRSVLLEESNRRIEEALRSAGTGDFSQRVDLRGLGERMQGLAEAYNEMAESLQREERVRRAAETALAEEERRFEAIAEASPVGIFRVDRDGRMAYHNRRAAEIAGVSFGEPRPERWEQAIHPDDRGRVLTAWRKAVLEHKPFRCEHRYLHENGAVVWVQAEASPERDRRDHFLGMVGTTTDISERKRGDAERLASQERLAIILDSIADAVIATDSEGRVTRMNPPAEDLCAWSEREARGRRLSEVLRFTTGKDATDELVRPCIDECRKIAPTSARDLVDRRGRTRRVERNAAPIRDAHDHVIGAVLCLRDVTERLEWSERVARARRLEAVGQLAAGIAHDFQNILTGISGEAEMLSIALGDDSPHAGGLLSIVQAADRANGLARELFAYAPISESEVIPLDAEDLVRELESRLQPVLGPRVKLEVVLDANAPRFIGDPTQISNALLNVALNARDAVTDAGTIRISTTRVVLDARAARERGLSAGEHVVFAIEDDGGGMSAETRAHLFEPFYTTKSGGGSGLGLAAVESCVGRHGGIVEVDSTIGKGSCFRLWFPATREPAVTLIPAQRPEIERGQGRILLVDDEEIVRNFAARCLREMGYDVTSCGDGTQAVEFFEQHPESFDLVLLDLIMPGMGGAEVFEELRRSDPEAAVLITSGYGEESSVRKLLDRGARGFLEKPFRVHELSQAVARYMRAAQRK